MEVTTIEFEDYGQDFLEFDIDEAGKIVGVRPAQFQLWSKHTVQNLSQLKVGGYVVINDVNYAFCGKDVQIKYRITSIKKSNETHKRTKSTAFCPAESAEYNR